MRELRAPPGEGAPAAPAAPLERFDGLAEVPAGVIYCEGHFPGEPILPGMAQLVCLVAEPAMKRWAELGPPCGLSKVKFRRPIRPGDSVGVTLERQGPDAVRFRLVCGADEAASGSVLFGVAPEKDPGTDTGTGTGTAAARGEFPPPSALLPHRSPLLLVDEVVGWEPGKRVRARHVVRADEPFARGGRVPVLVSLEYMAQTIGLYAGLAARGLGQPPSLGFLVACREMRCEVPSFSAGDELLLEAVHAFGDQRLGQFRCTTLLCGSTGDRVASRAVVSVFAGPLGDAARAQGVGG